MCLKKCTITDINEQSDKRPIEKESFLFENKVFLQNPKHNYSKLKMKN